jgi:hypothetical protein
MNQFSTVLGASALVLALGVACSDDSDGSPPATGGQAGRGGGGAAGAGAGSGGAAAGKGGSGGFSSGGGGGGGGAGGSVGGDAGSGSGGQPEGGVAGAPADGEVRAVVGQRCEVASTVGVVQISGFPTPYVQVTLYDRTDPWLGEAKLVTPTCAYHRYTPGVCQSCKDGETCSLAGECVPEPRTVKNAKLVVTTEGERREYVADAELGGISSMLDIGDETSAYAMTLSWDDVRVALEPLPVGSGELSELTVDIEGDSETPGALDVSWKPSEKGGFVRTRIPINHHAGGPTFTECSAPESAGALHADADMVNPLAVSTGLEFQGVEHLFIAAAETPQGCVEFRFGTQRLVLPD